MRALNLAELRALVDSPEFANWWDELCAARAAVESAQAHADDLTSQAAMMATKADLAERKGSERIGSASEREAAASRQHAESQRTENLAFEVVDRFEEQRELATRSWHRVNQIEEALNASRETKSGKHPSAAALQEAREAYERAEKRKNEIWSEVVKMWDTSLEQQLDSTAQAALAAREKRLADELFGESEVRRQRAARLREEVALASRERAEGDRKLEQLMQAARARFDTAVGGELLFFRDHGRATTALVVALVDDERTFGLPVKKLGIYEAERSQGAVALAPASDAPAERGAVDPVQDYLRAAKIQPQAEPLEAPPLAVETSAREPDAAPPPDPAVTPTR